MSLMLLPRNVCVALLLAYRKLISPMYGDVCRYYPSCSRYTLEAIQQWGVIRGIGLGIWRILRCNPWSAGGVDDIPTPAHEHRITAHGFVAAKERN